MHPTHVPLRVVTGAYILNSGLSKLKAGEEEQQQMHGWASSVYPFLGDLKPKEFAKLLGYGESKVRMLIIQGDLKSLKDGRSRRILPCWVDEYVAMRAAEAEEVWAS